jgi:hypothetical protein
LQKTQGRGTHVPDWESKKESKGWATRQTGKQGQNTETTVTEASGSTTYKTTPGKTGGQSTMVVRKDANGNTVYVKQEARTNNKDFTKPPDHVHYKKPIDKEVN